MTRSTLHLTDQGIATSNLWAVEKITKLRIQRIGGDDYTDDKGNPLHWAMDGVNMNANPPELSEGIEFYASHTDAVAGIPEFLADYGLTIEKEVSA